MEQKHRYHAIGLVGAGNSDAVIQALKVKHKVHVLNQQATDTSERLKKLCESASRAGATFKTLFDLLKQIVNLNRSKSYRRKQRRNRAMRQVYQSRKARRK